MMRVKETMTKENKIRNSKSNKISKKYQKEVNENKINTVMWTRRKGE